MIRINVLGTPSEVQEAIRGAVLARRARSYADRNPEIGRMINCADPSCVLGRHRDTVIHADLVYSTPHYDLDEETGLQKPEEEKRILIAPATRNGIMGAARFARQRFLSHRHPRTLEVKQRTEEMFAEDVEFADSCPSLSFQPDITACVREAIKIVNNRLRLKRERARAQAKLSRRINWGLAKPGARI